MGPSYIISCLESDAVRKWQALAYRHMSWSGSFVLVNHTSRPVESAAS